MKFGIRIFQIFLLGLILGSGLQASDLEPITGHLDMKGKVDQPVNIQTEQNSIVLIPVTGLTLDDAKRAQLIYWPTEGTFCQPVTSWSGEQSVIFSSKVKGMYLVAIVFPGACDPKDPKDQSTKLRKVEAIITVGDVSPGPGPEPPPGPKPPPEPVPVKGPLNYFIAEETDATTQDMAQLRSDSSIRTFIKQGKHHIYFIDKDGHSSDGVTKPVIFQEWFKLSAKGTLPYLIVADSKGTVLFEGPCPAKKDFLAFIQKFSSSEGSR